VKLSVLAPNIGRGGVKGTELQRLHPDLFTAYVHHNLPESSSSEELAIDANQEETEEGTL